MLVEDMRYRKFRANFVLASNQGMADFWFDSMMKAANDVDPDILHQMGKDRYPLPKEDMPYDQRKTDIACKLADLAPWAALGAFLAGALFVVITYFFASNYF
jgi:hypothetical protein